MSIQRYKPSIVSCIGEPGVFLSHEASFEGKFVLFTDHAAEVERLTAENYAIKCDRDGCMAALEKIAAERDAAVARAERAEEALRKAEWWTDRIHSALADSTRPKQSVGEMVYGLLDFIRTALAALAAAPDIGDATGKVESAPSEREKRLADSLDEILNYKGGAENALEDEYVMERARAALADTTNAGG